MTGRTATERNSAMSRQQILDLVHRFADAELNGDTAAYERLLSPDFTGIGPVGFVLDGRQWAARHEDLTNHAFEVLDPQVRLYGDAAVVTAVQRQRTTARGHDASGSFRLTLVAVRDGDRWAIANLQLSGPLRPPTAPPPSTPATAGPETISRDELRTAIDAGTAVTVDALPAPAYDRRHLPSALNLTAEDAPASAGDVLPDRAARIVVYSTDTSCTRGPDLAAELKRLGYRNVRLYADGIEDWVAAGLPIEAGGGA
jgi:rhodanese-related sulfurtransferase/ketosteroid isomerase-like protein